MYCCSNKYYATCVKCGTMKRKNIMRRICVPKDGPYALPTTLCFLCESCFLEFLDKYGISM